MDLRLLARPRSYAIIKKLYKRPEATQTSKIFTQASKSYTKDLVPAQSPLSPKALRSNIPVLKQSLTPSSTQITAAAPNSTPPSSTSSPTAAVAAPPGPPPSPSAATRPSTPASGMTGSTSITPKYVSTDPSHTRSTSFTPLLRPPLRTRACIAGLAFASTKIYADTTRVKQEDAAEVALQALTGAPSSPPQQQQQQQQQWMARQGVRAMGM